jgi:trehalose 6-phosphate phosphatase
MNWVSMLLPQLAGSDGLAWFLDFDGTLVEIVAKPDAVHLDARTRRALACLQREAGGAVAIVTGREIAVIDAFTAPLQLPVAGVHGLERRDHAGVTRSHALDPSFFSEADRLLAPLVARIPELIVERKSASVALHYRSRPDCERDCLAVMEEVARHGSNVRLQRGKMVIEARPDGGDKGTAIREFMAEVPFRGRKPVFAGDDVTDEDAFREVNGLGGVTIRVGPGPTSARYLAGSTAEFLDWLAECAGLGGQGGHVD